MGDTRTANSIKNSSATIFGKIAVNIIEFVLRTVLIKTLGIEYGGVSSLFTDVLNMLSLMELGMGSAIAFALYKPLAEHDNKKVNALMRFYKTAYNIIAAGVFLIGAGLVPFLGAIVKDVPDIKEDIRLLFMLYVAASSCSYLVTYKETLIRASQLSRIAVMIETAVQIVFMGIECIALLIFKEYLIYLVLRVASVLTRNFLISKEVQKRFPQVDFKTAEKLKTEDRQALLKDIKAMAMYKVSGVVLNGTDSIIISAFLGTSIVGIVGHYRMISNFIGNISNKVWNAVLPSVGNLAAVGNNEKQYRVFEKLTLGSFIYSAICSISLFVLMNPLVTVWLGKEYTVSFVTTIAIAINTYLVLTILPFQTFRDANGLFVQGKYRPVIMSVINIALSLALVKPWGVFGVLIATPFSRIVTQTWFDPYVVYKYVFHRSPLVYFKKFFVHTLITVACSVVITVILSQLSLSSGVLTLIVGALLCLIVPMAVYLLCFGRNDDFRNLLKALRSTAMRVIRKGKGR